MADVHAVGPVSLQVLQPTAQGIQELLGPSGRVPSGHVIGAQYPAFPVLASLPTADPALHAEQVFSPVQA